MGCGCKNAEGGCGCGTKRAEQPTVEEPDWIPDGDGRAIGQQDFAINLSPLHAETNKDRGHFKNLDCDLCSAKLLILTDEDDDENDYICLECSNIFDAEGVKYETFGAESFEAYRGRVQYDPELYGHEDVKRFRKTLVSMGFGEPIYDHYMTNKLPSKKTGIPANKAYYVAVMEKNGNYYPVGGYGAINYPKTWKFFNIAGGKEDNHASFTDPMLAFNAAKGKIAAKRKRGYKDTVYSLVANAETLEEIEGPTAEATSGGLHAPSSFAMTWEDGTGQSSASIPPNEIAWAENVQKAEGKFLGMGLMDWGIAAVTLFVAGKAVEWGLNRNKGNKVTKEAKGCGCGSKRTYNARGIAESQDEQNCAANGGTWIRGVRGSHPSHCNYGEDTLPKGGGIQNSLDGGVTFQSEYSVGQINPVEVEGQNDIHNAESVKLPQPHAGPQTAHRQNARRNLKMW